MILITEDLRDRILQHLGELMELQPDLTWSELKEAVELREAPLFVAPLPATPETWEAVREGMKR